MAGRRDFLKRFGIGIAAAPIAVQVAEAALTAPAKVAPVAVAPKAEPPVTANAAHTVHGQYFDSVFMYVHNAVLRANQATIADLVPIFSEADFVLRELQFTSSGHFAYRIQDGQGFYLSSGFVAADSARGSLAIAPEVLYPSCGRIWIDIEDLSGRANNIQMVFRGVNRYRLDMPSNYAVTTTACMNFSLPQSRINESEVRRRLRA